MEEAIKNLLMTVATGLISVAAAYATAYLKKAKERAQAELKQMDDEKAESLFMNALDVLDKLAEKTVQAIEQTTAKDLRQAVKGGTKDAADLKALAAEAFSDIYTQLKPEYVDALQSNLPDLGEYINNVIESKVLDAKALSCFSSEN